MLLLLLLLILLLLLLLLWLQKDPLTANVVPVERFLNMGQLIEAQRDGRLLEIFGCGTAAIVAPVKAILYEGEEIKVPTGDKAGPLTRRLWQDIIDIQYGRVVDHPWSVLLSDTV